MYLRNRCSIFSRIGRTVINTGGKIAHHGLAAAEYVGVSVVRGEDMTLGFEIGLYISRDAISKGDVATFKGALGKSRGLHRQLNILFVVHHVRIELGIRLGLIPAVHNSKRDPSVSLFHE